MFVVINNSLIFIIKQMIKLFVLKIWKKVQLIQD